MDAGNHKVCKNENGTLQLKWRGVLLTLNLQNPHHGVYGILAVQEDGKVRLLEFHGRDPKDVFPIIVHEEGELTWASRNCSEE